MPWAVGLAAAVGHGDPDAAAAYGARQYGARFPVVVPEPGSGANEPAMRGGRNGSVTHGGDSRRSGVSAR